MRSDPIYALEGLTVRTRGLRDKSLRLKALRDQLRKDREARKTEVEEISDQIDKLAKVGELFRALLDLLVVKQVQSVENVVTEGFKAIFQDQDLSFESALSTRYNKVAVDFFIREGSKDSPLSHRGPPKDSFGGGPLSVASLILRVLTVLRMGRWPFFVLDEALGAVSEDYSENTAKFLRDIATKMGADVVLVTQTQKQSFCDHANTAYKCSQVTEEDHTRHMVVRNIKQGGAQ